MRLRTWIVLACAALPLAAFAGAYDDFFKAVKFNDAAEVQTLLAKGFDPNAVEEERGETGLMQALRENSMKVVRVLLKSPDVDLEAKAHNGDTALMIAAYKGNLEAVKALLERGAQVNRPGWTALHYAATSGGNDIVQLLLDHSAYIDAESPNKTTPLMMAARSGRIMTVKLLLDEGADPTLKNTLGMTAIDFAEKGGFTDIAEGLAYRIARAKR